MGLGMGTKERGAVGGPFKVDRTPEWTVEDDGEATDLIGWCWGAPRSVRLVRGSRVWVNMKTRTVYKRKRKRKKRKGRK